MRPGVCLALFLLGAAPAAADDLEISVEGLRSGSGSISICVFREPVAFPDCGASTSASSRTVPADRASRPVVFAGLPAGAYAVTVLHDENGNGRLDTNFLGIPKEGVGISNNRLPRFSAPRFSDARFDMPKGRRQTVRLVYW